jgi:hypothetical protein
MSTIHLEITYIVHPIDRETFNFSDSNLENICLNRQFFMFKYLAIKRSFAKASINF